MKIIESAEKDLYYTKEHERIDFKGKVATPVSGKRWLVNTNLI